MTQALNKTTRIRKSKPRTLSAVPTPSLAPTELRATRPALPDIELFQREDDHASHEVRRRLSKLGLDFIAHSVEGNSLKHQYLLQASGHDRVPYMIDHRSGVRLSGSPEIRAYLHQEYGANDGRDASVESTLLVRMTLQVVDYARREWLPRLPRIVQRRLAKRLDRVVRISRDVDVAVEDLRDTFEEVLRLLRSR